MGFVNQTGSFLRAVKTCINLREEKSPRKNMKKDFVSPQKRELLKDAKKYI